MGRGMGGVRTAGDSRGDLSRGGRSGPVQSRGVPSNDPAVTPQVNCGYCGKPNHSENDCWRKSGKCLFCGSAEHQLMNCPNKLKIGDSIQRQEKSTSKQISAGGSRPKVPARVYILDYQQISDATKMVEDSFVNPNFMSEIDLKPIKLPYNLEVRTPTRDQSLLANLVYRDCKIWVGEQKLLADLMDLAIKGYDVILGMDWDSTRKMLSKGDQGYLAFLINTPSDKVRLDDMPVVKKYPDIFLEELESLSLKRQIAFKIDMTPGVQMPYRMALTELKELKLQL
ncbi:uncharacterized protein [Coffea arabica]|uniref:CCHC-type domain-containing protein n=1 Tax=Coffea arabica TaxID=13443 RepID=A0A6P6U079_COFAR|nr:uncharacterized protein LOC113705826 [Coffea arabica]